VSAVELDESTNEATAKVEADQFSLAIGRGGQNVRLAAELSNWKIKVVQEGGDGVAVSSEEGEEDVEKKLEETQKEDGAEDGGTKQEGKEKEDGMEPKSAGEDEPASTKATADEEEKK
jgi:N utilization substance protein A